MVKQTKIIPLLLEISDKRFAASGLKKPISLATVGFADSRLVPDDEAIIRDRFPDPGGRPRLPVPRFGRERCRPGISGVKRPTPKYKIIKNFFFPTTVRFVVKLPDGSTSPLSSTINDPSLDVSSKRNPL